ncbi:hypothetical protein GIB67_003734, partial [Kingdonia uniflora]
MRFKCPVLQGVHSSPIFAFFCGFALFMDGISMDKVYTSFMCNFTQICDSNIIFVLFDL